jgi:divalent metal cation (Fe/Co/Zn/Cd) transporter
VATRTPARKEKLHRRGLWLEWFTVAWNVVEAVVAVGVGIIVGSVALVGFGVDSGIEVISAVALLWRLYRAGPNASAEEHGDAERKALYLVGATFILLAAYITYEAIGALLSGDGPETSTVALVLSVVARRMGLPRAGAEHDVEHQVRHDAQGRWLRHDGSRRPGHDGSQQTGTDPTGGTRGADDREPRAGEGDR